MTPMQRRILKVEAERGGLRMPNAMTDLTDAQLEWLIAWTNGGAVAAPPADWLARVIWVCEREERAAAELQRREGHAQQH